MTAGPRPTPDDRRARQPAAARRPLRGTRSTGVERVPAPAGRGWPSALVGCPRRARHPAHEGPAAVRSRRTARRRPAPVLRLDPRGLPPPPDRQPLRPRARRPRRSSTPASPSPAASTPSGSPCRSPICCGSPSPSGSRSTPPCATSAACSPPGGPRHAALILVLFGVMPASWLVAWSSWGGNPRQYTFDFISGEMWSGQYLWGYLMTAIAVFLMPLMLLAHERGRTALGRRRRAAVCWLQPWQGATLALIVARRAVAVAVARAARRRPACAGARRVPARAVPPALYYFLLGKYDPAWELAGKSNAAGAMPEWSWPWWAIALTIAPLAIPAVLAYRLPAPSWQEKAVRVWPFAALAGLPASARDVPLPLVPGPRHPALDPRRAGRPHRLAPPAPARRRRAAGADDRARHRPQAGGLDPLHPQRRRPVLGLRRRGARDEGDRERPAARRRARLRLRRLHAAVPDRAGDVDRRAELDAASGARASGSPTG